MGKKIESAVFDTTYYPAAFMSCAVFLYLFKFVTPSLSAKMSSRYRELPFEKQVDWNTRVNSTIHATIVSCMCVYSFIKDDEISQDPIWWDSPMVRTSCAVVVGYFSADLIIMTVHYKHIGEVFYLFHHGASMYAYYYVTTYGVLAYFANFRLIAEFSTPFVNQRWFLDILGYRKTSPQFVINGVLMTLTFFVVRVACMPHYWMKVYSVYGTEPFNRLGHIQMVLVITCFILDVINLFWFYKVCQGIRKVVVLFFTSPSGEVKTVKAG